MLTDLAISGINSKNYQQEILRKKIACLVITVNCCESREVFKNLQVKYNWRNGKELGKKQQRVFPTES